MPKPYEDIKTAVIYGAGPGGAYCFRLLEEEGIKVKAFIDDFKTGEYFSKPIIKLEDLDKYKADGYFVGTGLIDRIKDYINKLQKIGKSQIFFSFIIPTINPELTPPLNYKDYLYLFEDNDYKNFLINSNFKDLVEGEISFDCLDVYFHKISDAFSVSFDLNDEFIEQTYSYHKINFDVEEGDIVLDCGANSSKTGFQHSTYFAQKSKTGKVYAFEPIPRIYDELLEDIKGYSNIIPINKGVWSENTIAYFEDNGESSTFKESGTIKVELIKIDDFVRENNIERVDFIKMDIEGAELDALKGAEWTIKTFKPKLAISLYHKPEDFYEIPQYIKSIVPEYKIWVLNNESHPWVGTKAFCRVEK